MSSKHFSKEGKKELYSQLEYKPPRLILESKSPTVPKTHYLFHCARIITTKKRGKIKIMAFHYFKNAAKIKKKCPKQIVDTRMLVLRHFEL